MINIEIVIMECQMIVVWPTLANITQTIDKIYMYTGNRICFIVYFFCIE